MNISTANSAVPNTKSTAERIEIFSIKEKNPPAKNNQITSDQIDMLSISYNLIVLTK